MAWRSACRWRSRRCAGRHCAPALLAATSIVQTIPGLALLALFYPLLLGAAALSERTLGFGFSALGFLPAVLALALYSMLPVVRNTITGIMGIDPAIKRAALGVGMTERQSLTMVELPLALPVIMAGVRTASVWVIGTATLSTPIGQTSLGNYIFAGLQTQNWIFVLFGCVAAAVLALAVDQLLALIERGYSARSRNQVAAGGDRPRPYRSAGPHPQPVGRTRGGYVIGAKPFAEQYILAALMEDRLRAKGLAATRRDGLGSAVIFDALAAGDIDAYVEYSGTLWANQMQRTDVRPARAGAVGGCGVAQGAARDRHGRRARLRERLRAGDDEKTCCRGRHRLDRGPCAARAPALSIAGDYEFFGRPEWKAIRDAYGLSFRQQRQMQAEFMYPAVAAGEIDVISAYTSDGRVAQFGLQVLDDPKHAIPPYDAILLVSPKRASDRAFVDALRPLIGKISVDLMREANRRAGEGASPEAAARWLAEKIGR